MRDAELVDFLQWALPRLRLRWAGFRKVRRQVGRRIAAHLADLGLDGLAAYRERLESQPAEWKRLDALCRVTISRYWRDAGTWEALLDHGLPRLAEAARAEGRDTLRAWSAGCASGEEPYSLLLAWSLGGGPELAGLRLEVLGTDFDEHLLERAAAGVHPEGALRDLPPGWRDAAFEPAEDGFVLRQSLRRGARFERRDLRAESPAGPFDLVLCRNLAFTYFEDALQREVLERLAGVLRPGALLVLGSHEHLPAGQELLRPWPDAASSLHRAH